MLTSSSTKVLIFFMTFLLLSVAATGQVRGSKSGDRTDLAVGELPDFTFNLTRIPEDATHYSLVISDSNEHVISGTYSIFQLQILRALLIEAEKFAFTGEAAGTTGPVTTRFLDKQENAFLVDVEKLGNQSRLFLTISAGRNSQTAEAGRVNRSIRRGDGFFFDLTSRLESVLPKLPAQSSK